MTEPVRLGLLRPLADLGNWLRGIPTYFVIVGGVAVSFLGQAWFTQDIDALAILPKSMWERALATAPGFAMSDLIEDFDKAVARRKGSP